MGDFIEGKLQFMQDFCSARNAADGSQMDANANVTSKDITVLEAELYKKETIALNRKLVQDKIKEMFGEGLAQQYVKDITSHLIYIHDETSLKPYCASISLYPFLLEGTKNMGGVSGPPQNLQAFNGSFVNLIYQVASNFAGAVATPEWLMYFNYFARKTYGRDYLRTHPQEIAQELQGVVYALNQPASARGNQSVFWNITLFDAYYFKGIFSSFYFPDGSQPQYDDIADLQCFFLDWIRSEREKEMLTFPVVTAALLIDVGTKMPKDTVFEHMCSSAMSHGSSFFLYQSTRVDSLSSCCRLRNELADNEFSHTLGAGGVSTGSFQVITINFNRWTQDGGNCDLIDRVHKYLVAHREVYQGYITKGLLPAYTAGYISLDKQFGTIGVNGMLEAYEYLEGDVDQPYDRWLASILSSFKSSNKAAHASYGFRFNTEFVPAENLGVKNAKWDKEDGLFVLRDCYNSYFFPVESTSLTVLDKLKLHGGEISQYLDGGAACHLNLGQLPSKQVATKLIRTAARLGVPFWTTNVKCTICNDCGYINPETWAYCSNCASRNVEYGTRIIGYLKRISNFSSARQQEAARRGYTNATI